MEFRIQGAEVTKGICYSWGYLTYTTADTEQSELLISTLKENKKAFNLVFEIVEKDAKIVFAKIEAYKLFQALQLWNGVFDNKISFVVDKNAVYKGSESRVLLQEALNKNDICIFMGGM